MLHDREASLPHLIVPVSQFVGKEPDANHIAVDKKGQGRVIRHSEDQVDQLQRRARDRCSVDQELPFATGKDLNLASIPLERNKPGSATA